MMTPRALQAGVSVVIPVKDRATLLGETLRSVGAQTRAVEEIIVVDDGSRDTSANVAREAGATVIENPSGGWGAARARNAGVERATTDVVCFVDSDDLLLPRAVEWLEDSLRQEASAPFAFGCALVVNRESGDWEAEGVTAPLEHELAHLLCALYARNFVPSCAVAVRTAAFRDAGGFSPDFVPVEDHHLWIRLAERGPPIHVSRVVGTYRRHGGNLMNPERGAASAERITLMSAEDSRLTDCRPERLGVQLVESSAFALRLHGAIRGVMTASGLLIGHPQRRRVALAAIRFWRLRRRQAIQARDLWRDDGELRAFLSSYV